MTINSKSTKAEILAAYKAMEKEKKALEASAKRNETTRIEKAGWETQTDVSSTATRSSSSQSNQNSETSQTSQIFNMIQQQIQARDIAKTIKILEQLQAGFGGAVSNLSEQLIAEATTLEEIGELIAEERSQLAELHELETITEDTIDSLIEQYKVSYKDFTEEFSLNSENKSQEITELVKGWQKEQETYQRTLKLRNEERKKSQQRDAEEYQYNLDLARDLDEEAYEQTKKAKYQELDTIRRELEQQWQEREESIAKQEKAYAAAKEQVAEFAEQLRKKVKQGEEEGKAIGTYQAKIKLDLRKKEIEGKRQNYELQIKSLQDSINIQNDRIQKLNQQLDLAQKQVQDLAVKAIEGTANRQSYEAMKEIAMEQAKTQQKGK